MNVATPDQIAVDFLTRLPIVERQVWSELLPELRALTFTIKLTKESDTQVRKAQAAEAMAQAKALIAGIPAGGDFRKAQRQITAQLTPFFPTPAQASRRAELLVRHWAGMARNAAWYRTLDRQRTAYPYWKYVTFGDNRVRATHEALDKKIIPASSPFWDTHFPPWAPMCRCMVVPVSQDEYDRIKAAEQKLPIEKRTIVDGPALTALETNNTIMTARRFPQPDGSTRFGPPTPFSTAPEPGWTGWNPKDLRITETALQDRYKEQPKEMSRLMKKADATTIAPGITLGDYIRGLPDGRRLPSIVLPASAPVTPVRPEQATVPQPVPPPAAAVLARDSIARTVARLQAWNAALTRAEAQEIASQFPGGPPDGTDTMIIVSLHNEPLPVPRDVLFPTA